MSFGFSITSAKLGKMFDKLRGKKTSYMLCFGTPAGKAVLDDLLIFCHAGKTTYDDDPRMQAALEGRREVILRIAQMMNIPSAQLMTLYFGVQTQTGEDNG